MDARRGPLYARVRHMPQSEKVARPTRVRKRLSVEFGPAYPLAHSGFTVNVSPRGLRVQSKFMHPQGTKLFLLARLPSGETCRVEGRVAWAQEGSQTLGIPNSMGIALTSADEAWFKLVAEVQYVDVGAPRTVVPPAPAMPDPPTPARLVKSAPPPVRAPEPSTPPPSRAPPTLEALKARAPVVRPPRVNERLRVHFGTSPRMELQGVTLDVSFGGVAIETLSLRPVGTKLFVELELPDGELAACEGEVVRTHKFDLLQRVPNSMAVRFTESDPLWRAFIATRVLEE